MADIHRMVTRKLARSAQVIVPIFKRRSILSFNQNSILVFKILNFSNASKKKNNTNVYYELLLDLFLRNYTHIFRNGWLAKFKVFCKQDKDTSPNNKLETLKHKLLHYFILIKKNRKKPGSK